MQIDKYLKYSTNEYFQKYLKYFTQGDLDYKSKYLKYKKKYLQLKGGYVDELNFKEKTHYSSLKNVEYIGGPVSKYVIKGSERDILLFGDYHDAGRKLDCGLDLEKNPDDINKIIYMTDYLEYYFKENSNKIVDVFMEFQYIGKETKKLQYKNGMLNNVYENFIDCYESLVDKEKCTNKYPNVRFHAADPRSVYENATMIFNLPLFLENEKINMERLLEQIQFIINTYLEVIHSEYINFFKNTIIDIKSNLQESIFILKLIRFEPNKYLNVYNKKIIQLKKSLDKLQKFLKYINEKKHIDYTKFTNIDYNNIREIDNIIDFYIKIPDLYNKIFVMFDLYSTNETREILEKSYSQNELENKLYDNIFNLEKIKKNFENIDNKTIKQQLERYFRDRIKLYVNKYNIVSFLVNLRKVLKQKLEYGEFIKENIEILSDIELQYNVMVMDFYLLARLLKKYKYDSTKKINQDYAKNIIIAAGNLHIEEYVKFFKDYMNYQVLYQENNLVERLNTPAPDIKDYVSLNAPKNWKRLERYQKKQKEFDEALQNYIKEHDKALNQKCVKV